jgi:hypothetical protein
MADIDVIIEALFGMGRATLIDALASFIIRFVFYVFAVCFIIFLLHIVAKALNRAIQLKRGFLGFLRKYHSSILIQSLLITLFFTAVAYNALFEFFVFVVMWAQLETSIILWRIEAGPHLVFRVSECVDLESDVCTTPGNIYYIHVKNAGRIPLHYVGLARVLSREMIPIKPELWSKHLEHPIISLAPGEVKPVIGINQSVSPNYVGKIFEICYSTPLRPYPLGECIQIELTIRGSSIEVYPLDLPIALNTPLLRLYKMWYEALTLPKFAYAFQYYLRTREKHQEL